MTTLRNNLSRYENILQSVAKDTAVDQKQFQSQTQQSHSVYLQKTVVDRGCGDM